MEDYKKAISDIFMEEKSNEYIICKKCYPVLQEWDSGEIFEHFFQLMEEYILRNDVQLQEEEKTKILDVKKKYNKFLDGILETLIKDDVDKDTFYEKLWNSIKNMPLCDDETEKAGILYILCRNDLIPYYTDGETKEIEKADLWDLVEKNTKDIIAARSIVKQYSIAKEGNVNAQIKDGIKYASMLLNLLEQCEDDKDKIVIMSYIIRFIETNSMDTVKKMLIKKISENH